MRTLMIVAFACCFLLIGCTPTVGTVDIEGKVFDEFTKEGIPNRIVLVQSMIYSNSELIPTNNFDRFCTDSTGHFTYKLKKTKNAYWYNFIFVGDTTYAYSSIEVCVTEFHRKPNFLSFYLDKLTDFTIQVERNKKTMPYDTLYLSWKTNGFDGKIYPHRVINYGIFPDLEFRWIGGNIKSRIETKTFANKNTIVHMDLYRNGKIKEMKDTIYCYRDVNNSFTFKY